jgi:hypothetical protein
MKVKGTTGIRSRRASALERLEAQLKTGMKPEKINGKTTTGKIPLSDGDKKRIAKEIEALNNTKKK